MIEDKDVSQEAVDCYAEIARQVLKLAELGYLRPRKEPNPFNIYELLKVSLDHKDGDPEDTFRFAFSSDDFTGSVFSVFVGEGFNVKSFPVNPEV